MRHFAVSHQRWSPVGRRALSPAFRSKPDTPMDAPTKFNLKYPGHCAACKQRMAEGSEAWGIKRPGERMWTVWHTALPCHSVMEAQGFSTDPARHPATSDVAVNGRNSFLDAYDAE